MTDVEYIFKYSDMWNKHPCSVCNTYAEWICVKCKKHFCDKHLANHREQEIANSIVDNL